jgi:hypothetical protein
MKIAYNGFLYESDNSKFDKSHILSNEHGPIIVYHFTSKENAKAIRARGFNFNNAVQRIIWFTFDNNNQNTGSTYNGDVIELYVSMKNPANWQEYKKYGLSELEHLGYDGALLDENGFVFNPNQLYIIK